jgi:deoxyribonuclease-4
MQKKKEKYEKSKEHIIKSLLAAEKVGAWSVVFHPAFYLGDDSKRVMERVITAIEEINSYLESIFFFFQCLA